MPKKIVFAAAALVLASGPAFADKTFDLSNVFFGAQYGGGQMTGFITLSDNLATLTALDILVPGGVWPSNPAWTFSPFEWHTADVNATQLPLNGFIRADNGGNELQLSFPSITNAGATLWVNNSYDFQPSGGFRLASGSLVPHVDAVTARAPEPMSLALVGAGLAGLGFVRRRDRKQKA